MRTFGLMAAGGILLFAVSGHPSFINLQLAGLILLARGGAGLWAGLGQDQRADLKRQFRIAIARGMKAFETVTADLSSDDSARVPLTDLLGQARRD